jgi:hypothetical protein
MTTIEKILPPKFLIEKRGDSHGIYSCKLSLFQDDEDSKSNQYMLGFEPEGEGINIESLQFIPSANSSAGSYEFWHHIRGQNTPESTLENIARSLNHSVNVIEQSLSRMRGESWLETNKDTLRYLIFPNKKEMGRVGEGHNSIPISGEELLLTTFTYKA